MEKEERKRMRCSEWWNSNYFAFGNEKKKNEWMLKCWFSDLVHYSIWVDEIGSKKRNKCSIRIFHWLSHFPWFTTGRFVALNHFSTSVNIHLFRNFGQTKMKKKNNNNFEWFELNTLECIERATNTGIAWYKIPGFHLLFHSNIFQIKSIW